MRDSDRRSYLICVLTCADGKIPRYQSKSGSPGYPLSIPSGINSGLHSVRTVGATNHELVGDGADRPDETVMAASAPDNIPAESSPCRQEGVHG